MIISPNQHRNFVSTITDFAGRNGLSVDIVYNSRANESMLDFDNKFSPLTIQHKGLRTFVRWDEKESVKDVTICIIDELTKRFDLKTSVPEHLKIKKAVFNNPCTIVLWEDGTKTVVKTQNNEVYDAEKGLAMCIAKKALGNKGNYFEVFKKYTDKHPYVGMKPEEYSKAEIAYLRLVNCIHDKKATKTDMTAAMEDAIGCLGEVLDI